MIASAGSIKNQDLRPPADGQSDTELVKACLTGSQRAWDELIERYARLIYSVPRRCGLNEADAEDVFQAVSIQLFRKLNTLRDGQRLCGWLLTTAHRESWRVCKKRRRDQDAEHTALDLAPPSEEQVATWERQQMVREALRQLGGRDEQLMIALMNTPGRPDYSAIARAIGMPVGSIGPTRARCFRKLERILAQMGFDGGDLLPQDIDEPTAAATG